MKGMSESSFYQHFHVRRLSRFMTKIKEKTYLQLGKKRKHRHTFLLETTTATTASENASSEIIHDLKREPTIENPVLPVICSLPPPPRYTQHRNKPHLINDAHTKIQTRSGFIATAKKPCLSRSNTLGHPTTSSPLATPDHDHPLPSPISVAAAAAVVDGKEQTKPQYPLELHTDILLLDDEMMHYDVKQADFISSRTPSLVNFPDSPSSSISRM